MYNIVFFSHSATVEHVCLKKVNHQKKIEIGWWSVRFKTNIFISL